jgi:hypothetical protein
VLQRLVNDAHKVSKLILTDVNENNFQSLSQAYISEGLCNTSLSPEMRKLLIESRDWVDNQIFSINDYVMQDNKMLATTTILDTEDVEAFTYWKMDESAHKRAIEWVY